VAAEARIRSCNFVVNYFWEDKRRKWTPLNPSSNTFFDCLESGAEEFQIHHANWFPIPISVINRSVLEKARACGGKRR
jgi:hypothetical protein